MAGGRAGARAVVGSSWPRARRRRPEFRESRIRTTQGSSWRRKRILSRLQARPDLPKSSRVMPARALVLLKVLATADHLAEPARHNVVGAPVAVPGQDLLRGPHSLAQVRTGDRPQLALSAPESARPHLRPSPQASTYHLVVLFDDRSCPRASKGKAALPQAERLARRAQATASRGWARGRSSSRERGRSTRCRRGVYLRRQVVLRLQVRSKVSSLGPDHLRPEKLTDVEADGAGEVADRQGVQECDGVVAHLIVGSRRAVGKQVNDGARARSNPALRRLQLEPKARVRGGALLQRHLKKCRQWTETLSLVVRFPAVSLARRWLRGTPTHLSTAVQRE